jgi:hypothetical protein
MVNYYIASLKLPTKRYESKQNYGLTIDGIDPISSGFPVVVKVQL